jgi:hypothetical protein
MLAVYAALGSSEDQDAGCPGLWLVAARTNQAPLVTGAHARRFVPPYAGAKGWVGVWLDRRPSWQAVAALLADAHARRAPWRSTAVGLTGVGGGGGPRAGR